MSTLSYGTSPYCTVGVSCLSLDSLVLLRGSCIYHLIRSLYLYSDHLSSLILGVLSNYTSSNMPLYLVGIWLSISLHFQYSSSQYLQCMLSELLIPKIGYTGINETLQEQVILRNQASLKIECILISLVMYTDNIQPVDSCSSRSSWFHGLIIILLILMYSERLRNPLTIVYLLNLYTNRSCVDFACKNTDRSIYGLCDCDSLAVYVTWTSRLNCSWN